ncbi:MAG TPA: type II toxin-antitoxin system RelB/DinJ family antitoxin [Candidatus Faecalibacterium intestinigallinarum]|uniref:Type II toxin-antitoxin system RelB/DinJ family antitoxin n=1 Tax=Candidatus Faecalibacterium intestinigallinarum TaxID=2838581 RepID=A0A9D1QAF5_9FIRM|nr:type II toxin-antitoxin system RelB/DinJ family antitoxin [Candidatus Faecalibacterium intestinigallinarum]
MTPVSTNIKIDPVLKEQAQDLFESLGMNLTTAVNIFLRQSVREQAIPFRIGEPVPNAETLQAIRDARNGVGLSRGFTSVKELMEDLDADD